MINTILRNIITEDTSDIAYARYCEVLTMPGMLGAWHERTDPYDRLIRSIIWEIQL